jgi:hypothetical protein
MQFNQPEQLPTNNPFIVEEKSTLVSGNLVSPGSLRVHAHNVYVNNANATGRFDRPTHVKQRVSVNSGQETLRESSQGNNILDNSTLLCGLAHRRLAFVPLECAPES